MKFITKKQASDKYNYMLLDRLIQDAKYFISYPELKHLWTWDLNTHIEKMLELYNSLNPKPEWTSEEEINNLASQMKEAYKNHWNEGHPDNKIEAAEQPTTPKPTTTLPDNMMYAWDPKANQWIAVMKDNPVVTPPTYNPNNVNNLNNTTTTQMYTPIKSTLIDSLNQFLDGDRYSREIKIEKGLISDGLIKLAGINPIKGPKYSITDKGLQLLKQAAQEEYNKEKKSYLLDGIAESKIQTGTPEEQGQMPKFSIFEKDGSELAQIQANNETDAKVKFIMENPEYEGSQTISVKKIDSTYSETTTKGLDFPNQSVSPSTDVKVDPKGWVNMAGLKIEAARLTPQLLQLGGILTPYMKNNSVDVYIEDENKNKLSARGAAEVINKLEHEIKDIGIYCSTDTLPVDKNKGIYTLDIFLE